MSERDDKAKLAVTFKGKNPSNVRDVMETLMALDDLHRTLSRELTGQEVGLSISGFYWACDGCGAQVSAIPDDWTRVGTDDLCPNCSGSGTAE